MAKKNNFNSQAANLIQEAEQSPVAPRVKGKITTFEIAPDLDHKLSRVAFWGGLDESKRNVINTALAYYFENNPDAREKAGKPAPGEK